jgi:MarR family transcriptional regulator, temperature-dependent positive regulator of motility
MSDPESEPFRLATSASHLLHRAEQLAADRFSQLVGDAVTLRQFAVLVAISEQPGLSQSDLVRATGIDRSTLADMMNRLAKRGLVQRTESTIDARAYSVRLSASGASILAAATQHARAADAAILDLLPRTKRRTFLGTLTKLSRLAEQAAEKREREAKRQAKRDARKQRQQRKGRQETKTRPAAAAVKPGPKKRV